MGHSEETKKKLSIARKGLKFSEEWKKNIGIGSSKSMTLERRLKISKQQLGKRRGKTPDWIKKRISEGRKGIKHTEEAKEKMRIGVMKHISYLKNNGQPITPMVGKYEKQILDIFEKACSIKLERQFQIAGYFLDGYDKEYNVAIEVDEDYSHSKTEERDNHRMDIITNKLGCKFIRIGITRHDKIYTKIDKRKIKAKVLLTMKDRYTRDGLPESYYDWENSDEKLVVEVINEVLKRV